ncbi:hypothetical protein TIFTF001_055200, partial [Ficus carica]
MVGPCCPCHRPFPADNRTVAGHTTPTTLHHLTPDIRYMSLYLSLSLLRCHPPPTDQTDIVSATYTSTNDLYSCPPHHPNSRARGTRIVEVKYPYIRSMFTHWDHSEYDPSGSTKDPNLWEIPINKGVPHYLRHPTNVSLIP